MGSHTGHHLINGVLRTSGVGEAADPGAQQPTSFPFQTQFDSLAVDEDVPSWMTTHGTDENFVAKAIGHSATAVPDYATACGQSKAIWYADANASGWGLGVPLPAGITFGSGTIKWEVFMECSANYTTTGARFQNTAPGQAMDEAIGIQWAQGGDYAQSAMYHNGSGSWDAGFSPGFTWGYGDILGPVVQQGYINLATGYMEAKLFGREDTNNGRQSSPLTSKTMALTMDSVAATWLYIHGSRTTASAHEWAVINFWVAIDATAFPGGDKQ
jgi:hypothetical protein